jgi:uncharacterized HAD superfamily protein
MNRCNDFDNLKKQEMKKYGKVHAEAWIHKHIDKDLDKMKEKQTLATRALYTAKSYEYLQKKFAQQPELFT